MRKRENDWGEKAEDKECLVMRESWNKQEKRERDWECFMKYKKV